MKNALLSVLLLISGMASFAQQQPQRKSEVIVLRDSVVDFGRIPQGKPVSYIFEWKNNSNKPVKIDEVQVSCGCTTPEWSRDAVGPGKNANIKVGYNAEAEGPFDKTIMVYAGEDRKLLRIRGNVYRTPATSAPLNPSIAMFKQINQ